MAKKKETKKTTRKPSKRSQALKFLNDIDDMCESAKQNNVIKDVHEIKKIRYLAKALREFI